MKKIINITSLVVLTLLISVPFISRAESNRNTPSNKPSPLKTLQKETEQRKLNIETNQEYRKNIIEDRNNLASSTHAEVKIIRTESRTEIKLASTTKDKRSIKNNMRLSIFALEQQKKSHNLDTAISNLKQIRDRIKTRISKEETAGKNLSTASSLLIIADQKIEISQTKLQAFKDYTPDITIDNNSSTETSGTSTKVVSLIKARQEVDSVRDAIRDAHKSLVDVVISIANSMNIKNRNTSTTIEATSTVSTSTQ